MPKLAQFRRQLEGTDEKEKAELDESLNKAVLHGNLGVELSFSDSVQKIGESGRKHTDSATKSIVTELSKVSPPILQMIVDSHNGLLERVELLEDSMTKKQVKDSSELLKTLGSAAKKLEKIEKRKFPVISMGGINRGINDVSVELTTAMALISRRLDDQDKVIKAVRSTVGKKRVFDFDFIRKDSSDLLVKITATERT